MRPEDTAVGNRVSIVRGRSKLTAEARSTRRKTRRNAEGVRKKQGSPRRRGARGGRRGETQRELGRSKLTAEARSTRRETRRNAEGLGASPGRRQREGGVRC